MKKNELAQLLLVSCISAVVAAENPVIYLDETYENYTEGTVPAGSALCRVARVAIINGEGKVGQGKAARFCGNNTSGGSLEYIAGPGGATSLFVEFDLLSNRPGDANESSPVIFSVGIWDSSKKMLLSASANRAFGVELYQAGSSGMLLLRAGTSSVLRGSYDLAIPQHVKIWVNDHDQNTLSYKRPDTGESVLLNPDSFVVWLNDKLIGKEPAFGYAMQKSVTAGSGVLGRVGFSSSSTAKVDFLIDNLRIEKPTGESVPAAAGQIGQVLPSATEKTPDSMPGAETMSYRAGRNTMNLFVYKPKDWKSTGRRAAMVYFFGGGWTKGTPLTSVFWGTWAASQGMVGITPDYRTKNRFGTSPLSSVADSRAAFNWVVEHAEELGIDSTKIVVGGSSAGAHVAIWTAIKGTPPGSDPTESPKIKPAALFLSSAVTDTSEATGYGSRRFGKDAKALSPIDQLDPIMPPVLMFHAVDDAVVHYTTAVALHDKLMASGNKCELITVPQGDHGYFSTPGWKEKVCAEFEQFLKNENILSVLP